MTSSSDRILKAIAEHKGVSLPEDPPHTASEAARRIIRALPAATEFTSEQIMLAVKRDHPEVCGKKDVREMVYRQVRKLVDSAEVHCVRVDGTRVVWGRL